MEWLATYALALALSVPAANDSPDVEIRFDASSQMQRVRIGDAVVLAKNATLTLTAGDDEKGRSGQASFTGSVTVSDDSVTISDDVEGFACKFQCERAAYDFGRETWTFEKIELRATKDGQKHTVWADRMTLSPQGLNIHRLSDYWIE